MKSAITFYPTKAYHNQLLVGHIGLLADWCRDLAETSGQTVKLLMQHNLKKDLLTVSAELPKKTISASGKHPRIVISDISAKVYQEYRKHLRNYYASRKKKERSTRAKNR